MKKNIKKLKLPVQGKAIMRRGSVTALTTYVSASVDCDVCCSVSGNCPGCSCSNARY